MSVHQKRHQALVFFRFELEELTARLLKPDVYEGETVDSRRTRRIAILRLLGALDLVNDLEEDAIRAWGPEAQAKLLNKIEAGRDRRSLVIEEITDGRWRL